MLAMRSLATAPTGSKDATRQIPLRTRMRQPTARSRGLFFVDRWGTIDCGPTRSANLLLPNGPAPSASDAAGQGLQCHGESAYSGARVST